MYTDELEERSAFKKKTDLAENKIYNEIQYIPQNAAKILLMMLSKFFLFIIKK